VIRLLTDRTRGLVGRDLLARVKPGAILVTWRAAW
jgi:phosphoglycerate dehydrogenase-like enzyme